MTAVLRGSRWNMTAGAGLAHEQLEASFATFVGTRHAVAVNTGGMALQMSMRALGLVPGDEVVHQVDTCSATALAVMAAGCTPLFADVDEVHLGRVIPGGRVDVTFRGSATIYKGKIARVAPTVKRMQRIEPDGATSTDARVVQVEIELDDPSSMPQVLGRETRVTFL